MKHYKMSLREIRLHTPDEQALMIRAILEDPIQDKQPLKFNTEEEYQQWKSKRGR